VTNSEQPITIKLTNLNLYKNDFLIINKKKFILHLKINVEKFVLFVLV